MGNDDANKKKKPVKTIYLKFYLKIDYASNAVWSACAHNFGKILWCIRSDEELNMWRFDECFQHTHNNVIKCAIYVTHYLNPNKKPKTVATN